MKALSRLVLFLTLFSFVAQPVMADSLTSNDLNFAFGGGTAVSKTINQPASSLTKAKRPPQQLASLQPLSDQEMQETEGAILPFIALAARIGYTGYRAYRTYRTYRTVRNTYRMGRSAWRATRGYRATFDRYKSGAGYGMNVRTRTGRRIFGAGVTRFKLNGQMVRRPNLHYGRTNSQIRKHRPWQGGWRWR